MPKLFGKYVHKFLRLLQTQALPHKQRIQTSFLNVHLRNWKYQVTLSDILCIFIYIYLRIGYCMHTHPSRYVCI